MTNTAQMRSPWSVHALWPLLSGSLGAPTWAGTATSRRSSQRSGGLEAAAVGRPARCSVDFLQTFPGPINTGRHRRPARVRSRWGDRGAHTERGSLVCTCPTCTVCSDGHPTARSQQGETVTAAPPPSPAQEVAVYTSAGEGGLAHPHGSS